MTIVHKTNWCQFSVKFPPLSGCQLDKSERKNLDSLSLLEYDGKMSDSLADTPYLHLQGFYHQIILQDLE